MRSRSSRRADEDSRRTSLSEISEDSEAVSESAEDVIFALFGPRVWDHEGEWDVTETPVIDKPRPSPSLTSRPQKGKEEFGLWASH